MQQATGKVARILVYTDLEGTPGLDSWDYEHLLAKEQRAAAVARHTRVVARFCELLLEGKRLQQVLLVEGHPDSVLRSELPENVQYAKMHELGPYLPRVDRDWRIAMIGAHGMEGSGPPLGHTSSSRNPQRWFIDGAEVGEVGITAAWAGAYGSWIGFVHGTAAACDEAERVCPGVVTARVRLPDGQDLSEPEEMALLESCCCLINESVSEGQPWCIPEAAKIERFFVGRTVAQRFRSAAWLSSWWLTRILLHWRCGAPNRQLALAGKCVARTIEQIFGGPKGILLSLWNHWQASGGWQDPGGGRGGTED